MTAYAYRAKDPSGQTVKGVLSAEDARGLWQQLDQRGYVLVSYHERGNDERKRKRKEQKAKQDGKEKTRHERGVFWKGSGVPTKHLAMFSDQMATLLDAGVSLPRALEIVLRQTTHEGLQRAQQEILAAICAGESLSEAIRERPQVFPALFAHMVRAGEMGGGLPRVFQTLNQSFEKQMNTSRKIKGAMAYPAVLAVASVGAVIFMLTFAVPQLVAIFEDLGANPPGTTMFFLKLGLGLKDHGFVMALSCPLMVLGFVAVGRTEIGRYHIDRLKLALPLLGPLIQKMVLSRFADVLSLLVSAGVPLLTVLGVVRNVVGNASVERAVDQLTEGIKHGKTLHDSFSETQMFPEMVLSMVNVGEESGRLSEMFEKVSRRYDQEVDDAIKTFVKVIEPALIAVMTVVVGLIAGSLFVPLADISTAIG